MARVVVIGDLMTDAVARATLPLARGSDTPANVTMHGGGSGANIAAWMAADGGDVAFVGRRGADIAGRNRDMELMGYGVDARLVMDPERPTGTCVVMVTHKGEHTMLSDPGANAALSPDDLPHDLFVPGAHLHVSGYTLLSEGARAAGLAAIDYARRTNMTASVDAASAAPLERAGAEPFLELSSGAVLLFVNAAQAKVLTGREDPEQAARVLTAWYPHVAVKLGRRRRAVLRQRPAAGAGARAAGGPGGRRHRGRGRVHRRLPARLAGQEAAGRGAGRRLPAGRARARPHRRAPRFVSAQPPFLDGAFLARRAHRRGHRRVLGDRRGDGRGAGPGRGPGRAGGAGRRAAGGGGGRRCAACGAKAAWVSADLAERAEVARAADEAAAAFGPPDILVNCAGINLRPPLGSLTVEDWDATMAVNLTAPFLLGQRFGPDMAERGWGRIINVTSQQAARAFGNSGGYGASKGGLAALTRSQSEAWAPSGVCCNSVCPGFVPTRLNAHVARDPERSAAMAARTMTGRNGSPEDFAGVAVFLASRASDYVTGQTLYVDGGFSVT